MHARCFKKLRFFLSEEAWVASYKSYMRLILGYADIVRSGLCKIQADSLEHFHLHYSHTLATPMSLKLFIFMH